MTHLLAYIDPGSGSLIIQVVIATIVAIPIFFRTQIGRVVHAIRGPKAGATSEAEKSPAGDRINTDGANTD